MVSMPAADLPSLETRLETCLIELERLYEARPRMSDALARAGAGQRIDELLDEIGGRLDAALGSSLDGVTAAVDGLDQSLQIAMATELAQPAGTGRVTCGPWPCC